VNTGLKGSYGRAAAFLSADLEKRISLEDAAAEAGLSKYHFLRSFKKQTGVSPHVYRTQRRVDEPKKQPPIRRSSLLLGGYNLVMEMAFALLSCAEAFLVFGNELPLFQYLMFIIVSREVYKPFLDMESHWLNYIKVKDSYSRIRSVAEAPPAPETANPRVPSSFDINFEKVGFSYEENGFRLKGADFTIPQGSLTALVGPSGSGKTTITNLLLRFWDLTGGSIKIGGIDTREIAYDTLLGNVSIVMQNVRLFADTIYNNIRIGSRYASKEEIFDADGKAMIHDFIMSLPDGYQTVIGETGLGLSGGQKQRLSIARAFLKDSPIVILDEMTSNVDPVNEVKIQSAVSRLAEDRTVIVIAHRLSTIRSADCIIVLEDGRIVEKGRHADLMNQGGLYRSLVEKQNTASRWQLQGGFALSSPVLNCRLRLEKKGSTAL
jgi:ATP-binding cassette, subfamily B, bacterial IrtB/YbtQ